MSIEINKQYRLRDMPDHAKVYNDWIVKVEAYEGGLWRVRSVDNKEIFGQVEEKHLELIEQPVPVQDEQLMPTQILTLQDAFRYEIEKKKPKYDAVSEAWVKEGRCPKCGHQCYYHLSTPICKEHGSV